jgi:hypothetical protein
MKTNSLIQLFNQHKVVIPPIQRDYAQGRNTGKIPHIRERFLDSIVNVLTDDSLSPMELDFVYGYIEKDKSTQDEISVFKPLDGQQRLTTLFLIHWYFANKEGKMEEAKELLNKFSYATRQSSRSFCEKLVAFTPQIGSISVDEQIENQPWFFSTWKSDPTILSMLVVLKDIDAKFGKLENVWDKLNGEAPRIVFHLLPMDDLGLPDDLYIKMNARGKGLTDFEHFKSQFSEILSGDDAKIFNEKIDKEWSDLFWCIFKDKPSDDIAKDVDNGFLSFFWYITNLLVVKNNIEPKGTFWIDIIRDVYKKSPENVKFLFDSLNLFEKLEREQPNYFDEVFYIKSEDFEVTKTRIFFNNSQANLFRKCAETYGFDEKKNTFSVGEQLLLYAFILMNLKNGVLDKTKFRFLRNIFASSEVQLRNEYLSTFLYADIEAILEKHEYSADSKLSKRQFEEEKLKNSLMISHPDLKETIYRLEDHTLLRGNIALFDFDSKLPVYAEQFHKIFVPGCEYFDISKAMLTIGDYTQGYGKFRRFGNKNNSTWREIFTQSENRKGFENTQSVVKSYLEIFLAKASKTNMEITDEYLTNKESNSQTIKDIRYYYIKYRSFIFWGDYSTDGFYWWEDYQNNPYECTMLFRTNYRGRHWNPFLLQLRVMNDKCSLGNYGDHLQYTAGDLILLIINKNNGFKFSAVDDFSLGKLSQLITSKVLNDEGILVINQNENGLDVEDRITRCMDFLQSLHTVTA